MVINFRARGISQDACKLIWTPALIIKKKLTELLLNESRRLFKTICKQGLKDVKANN
jgi:hypothetical protein